MKVLIIETNEVKELPRLKHEDTGIDHTFDFLDCEKGFGFNTQDSFVRIDSLDNQYDYQGVDAEYITGKENFNYWQDILTKKQKTNELIERHRDDLSEKLINELEKAAKYSDLGASTDIRFLIINRALANVELKDKVQEDLGYVTIGKHMRIYEKQTIRCGDNCLVIKYFIGGDFVLLDGEDVIGEFNAIMSGNYDSDHGSTDNELVINNSFICSENLSLSQHRKMEQILTNGLKAYLSCLGFHVDSVVKSWETKNTREISCA